MGEEVVVERLEKWWEVWGRDWNDGAEHKCAILIETLYGDTFGWSIKIDLVGTFLERRQFDSQRVRRADHDWFVARVEQTGPGEPPSLQWNASCGPLNLEETIGVFLDWAEPKVFSEYEGSRVWGVVDQAIADLVESRDLEETTARRYIVGSIVQDLSENDSPDSQVPEVVEQAISDLVENQDLDEKTERRLIVDHIVRALSTSES
jgi:immunity protein 53 of polymorphic toxin system